MLTQRHRLFDFWLKQFCHRGKDRHDHRVTELAIGLSVRNRNAEFRFSRRFKTH
ncbi:Uncharacterised protein [Shigella sonnei]|nr:Uncharacterised protein [Shigella sonnei]